MAGRRNPFIIIAALDFCTDQNWEQSQETIKLIRLFDIIGEVPPTRKSAIARRWLRKLNTTTIMIDTPLEGECYTWWFEYAHCCWGRRWRRRLVSFVWPTTLTRRERELPSYMYWSHSVNTNCITLNRVWNSWQFFNSRGAPPSQLMYQGGDPQGGRGGGVLQCQEWVRPTTSMSAWRASQQKYIYRY